MENGRETLLTSTPGDETHPYISADGSKVLYQSPQPNPAIYIRRIDKGVAERFCDDCGLPMGWWPGGERIIFHRREGDSGKWRSIDIVSRERFELISHPKRTLHMPRLSFDGKWIAFHLPMVEEEGRSPIFIAPVENGAVSESAWIPLTSGKDIETTPWWSPDGGILYFLSKRDGFQCIWHQPLDRGTKRHVGSPAAIAHFHGTGQRVREVGFGPGVAGDKIIFTLSASKGNLWMTKLEDPR